MSLKTTCPEAALLFCLDQNRPKLQALLDELPEYKLVEDKSQEWGESYCRKKLGRFLGLIKSEAKAKSSRENGKLGGRPLSSGAVSKRTEY